MLELFKKLNKNKKIRFMISLVMVVISALMQVFIINVFMNPCNLISGGFTGIALFMNKVADLMHVRFTTSAGIMLQYTSCFILRKKPFPNVLYCWVRYSLRSYLYFSKYSSLNLCSPIRFSTYFLAAFYGAFRSLLHSRLADRPEERTLLPSMCPTRSIKESGIMCFISIASCMYAMDSYLAGKKPAIRSSSSSFRQKRSRDCISVMRRSRSNLPHPNRSWWSTVSWQHAGTEWAWSKHTAPTRIRNITSANQWSALIRQETSLRK